MTIFRARNNDGFFFSGKKSVFGIDSVFPFQRMGKIFFFIILFSKTQRFFNGLIVESVFHLDPTNIYGGCVHLKFVPPFFLFYFILLRSPTSPCQIGVPENVFNEAFQLCRI